MCISKPFLLTRTEVFEVRNYSLAASNEFNKNNNDVLTEENFAMK